MISTTSRGPLVLFLGALLALHAVVLKQEWSGIPVRTDFSIFYTAGTIVANHHGHELYDYELQKSVQQSSIRRGLREQDYVLPFNHPPFEALLFVPLAALPYAPAYFVWVGSSLALLLITGIALNGHLSLLRTVPLWLWMLACLAYSPIFICLTLGQDSIVLLLCYTLAWVALLRKSDFSAGAWLGLGLAKYHLVLPFMVAFVLEKRAKVLAGFGVVAVVLGLISLLTVGWQGLLSYPRFLLFSERSTEQQLTAEQPNLHGFLVTTLGNSRRVEVLVLAASVVLLAVAWRGWRSAEAWGILPRQLAFAQNLLVTLLVSYHAYVQDLSLLFLVLLLTLDVLMARPALAIWSSKTLIVCLTTLLFSPIYLVLILRFGHLWVLTPVLLFLLLALMCGLRALARQSLVQATQGPKLSAEGRTPKNKGAGC